MCRREEEIDRASANRLTFPLLYTGFILAGAGCALPGALLPATLAAWHLTDRTAGLLFLVIAIGSALGSLTILDRLWHSLFLGFTLLALAAITWSAAHTLIFPAAFLWGLSLGMIMTAITLIQQRFEPEKTVGLVRLNLVWALGAFACPTLLTHSLRSNSPQGCLVAVAAEASVLALVVLLIRPPARRSIRPAPLSPGSTHDLSPALIIATALATGVEASAGAWLATYAQRSTHQLAYTVAAPSCLWGGLLCTRFLGSTPGAGQVLQSSLKPILALVAAASFGLLLPSPPALLISAFLLGCGLGPIYPILLTRVLQSTNTTWIFFLCGISSALLQLLTGVISTRFASLQIGLSVLVVGAIVLLFAGSALPQFTQTERQS